MILLHIKIISLNLKDHLVSMDGCGVGYKTGTGRVYHKYIVPEVLMRKYNRS